jgi:hypothetical protein
MDLATLRDIISSGAYSENAKAIRAMYFDTFGTRVKSRCADCLKDATLVLYSKLSENGDTRQYRLYHYTAVYDKISGRAYTDVTLTDKIAERVLKDEPNLRDKFKKVPQM